MHRGWLALLAVGVMAPVATTLGPEAHSSAAARAIPCAQVMFIGARGDSQPPSGHHGVGPVLERIGRAVARRAAHERMTMGWTALPMRSAPVETLVPSQRLRRLYRTNPDKALRIYRRHNLAAYDEGVAAEVTQVGWTLAAVATNCPGSQVVLAGFSQGAAVIREGSVAAQTHAGGLPLVRATVLVADPDRNAADPEVTSLGTAPSGGSGVRTRLHASRGRVDLPVTEVCRARDLACDFGGQVFRHPQRALAAHLGYARRVSGAWRFAAALDQAARQAAAAITAPTAAVDFSGTGPSYQSATTVGGHPMTAFGPDPRDAGQQVSSIEDPAGTVTFVGATWLHQHDIPDMWAGDSNFTDYYTQPGSGGGRNLVLQLPPGTKAFSFWTGADLQIPPFPEYFALVVDGTVISRGSAGYGPMYYGIHALGGHDLNTVEIAYPYLAVGRFAISYE